MRTYLSFYKFHPINVFLVSFLIVFVATLISSCSNGNQSPSSTGNPDQAIQNEEPLPEDALRMAIGVSGQVTDSEGLPISEVSITVTKGSVAVPEMVILSDAEGNYLWPLPAGTYTIAVHKDGFEITEKEITIQDNELAILDFILVGMP